jgi:hypothetical protein
VQAWPVAILPDERIVIETPTEKRWRRLLLRIDAPEAGSDVLNPCSMLPMRPAGLVTTMRRLQRAARRRTPRGGASRRA